MPRTARLIIGLAAVVILSAEVRAQSTYRCWNFNAGGRGGMCRTSPPIIFNADGSYQESSARGTYSVSGDRVTMSASTIRGPGLISGNNIVFQYSYQGLDYTVTYLLQSGPVLTAAAGSGTLRSARRVASAPTASKVTVDLTLRFPPRDGSIGWIATVILIPEGQLPQRPNRYNEQDAIVHRATHTVSARFDPPLNAVETGRVYDIWIDTGMEKRRVGKVDLTGVTRDMAVTVDAKTAERLSPR